MPRDATELSLDDLASRAVRAWTVWGPCSGGVRVVYFMDGHLYTYSGGDARDADSSGIVERTIAEYARGEADPRVMEWLRGAGHWPEGVAS